MSGTRHTGYLLNPRQPIYTENVEVQGFNNLTKARLPLWKFPRTLFPPIAAVL